MGSEIRADSTANLFAICSCSILTRLQGRQHPPFCPIKSDMCCLLHQGIWYSPNFTHSESKLNRTDLDWGSYSSKVVHWSIELNKLREGTSPKWVNLCIERQWRGLFPIVFDGNKETTLLQVSKVVDLKLMWVFLHVFSCWSVAISSEDLSKL